MSPGDEEYCVRGPLGPADEASSYFLPVTIYRN